MAYTRGNDLSGSLEGAGGIGDLLGRSQSYSGGSWGRHDHYHADGNGNVTYLVTAAQGLGAHYRYDPYGRIMRMYGTLMNSNLYRYSSKRRHALTGMYYYGYRFYDPNLQRWPNRDPIGEKGGLNLYQFVRNEPMGNVDPLGLCSQQDVDNMAIYMGLMFNQRTAKSGLETCGVLCCSAKTHQVYAGKVAVAPSRDASCPMTQSQCECGDSPVAYWHTHPKGYDRMVPDDPNKFPWDRKNMRGMRPVVPWYMTNPKDETTILDPATGKEWVIYPIQAL